eukprot:14065926-Ditylum_brightwellii.AAC.1
MAILKKKSRMIYYLCPSTFKQYTHPLVFQETSTYGSELVAEGITVDLAVEMRYNLRMLGVSMKGTTDFFGDNKKMITHTSLPHSTFKKHVSVNNYHWVREAVVSRIASVVHCDTKYNLADLGIKLLNGAVYWFLLQNQNVPPVLTARECKTNMKKQPGVAISGTAKYVHIVLSPLGMENIASFEDKGFISCLCTT